MKINGKEVDMQKIIQLYERERRMAKDTRDKRNEKLKEWWNSEPGMICKAENAARLKERACHRQCIKYLLTDVNTNDTYDIIGQDNLANFLGYKSFNSALRVRVMTEGEVSNKSKTKKYNIKEIL